MICSHWRTCLRNDLLGWLGCHEPIVVMFKMHGEHLNHLQVQGIKRGCQGDKLKEIEPSLWAERMDKSCAKISIPTQQYNWEIVTTLLRWKRIWKLVPVKWNSLCHQLQFWYHSNCQTICYYQEPSDNPFYLKKFQNVFGALVTDVSNDSELLYPQYCVKFAVCIVFIDM